MKALRIHEYGGKLQQEQSVEPVAAPGQLLVRVAASSLNPIDLGRASGQMRQMFPVEFPWIPGGDVSGEVVAADEDITGFKTGDTVFGYSVPGGAYAELIAIDAKAVAHQPAKLTHEQAASLPVVSITAAQALALAELKPGSTVLIHGGAGGVGTIAIQLAHAASMHVVATAKASQKNALQDIGADEVIEGTESNLTGKLGLFDAVLDLVGGPLQQHLYGLVRRGGTLVTANQPPDAKQSESAGIKAAMVQSNVTTEGLEDIARHIVAGTLRPVVKQSESLWNPDRIWTKQPSGAAIGKTVFVVQAA